MAYTCRSFVWMLSLCGWVPACALPPAVGAPARVVAASAPVAPAPPALQQASIPRFFEVGSRVYVSPGEPPIDTTGWVRRLLEQRLTSDGSLPGRAEDAYRPFLYSEPDPASRQLVRYALMLPRPRPYSANDRVAAYWSESAEPFEFSVSGSQSFGSLAEPSSSGGPRLRRLKALFTPAGTNVQAYELIYDVEGTELRLFEHKGLIPGLPVSFERFTLYRPSAATAGMEPEAVSSGLDLRLGFAPRDATAWSLLETFEVGGHNVALTSDAHGDLYFLAAPLALRPSWSFGGVAADLVVESALPKSAGEATNRAIAALFVPNAAHGTLLSGRVESRQDIAGYIERASAFLLGHDRAMADLARHGPEGAAFLQHFSDVFLATHQSRRDPRTLTELPYADHFYPENAARGSGRVRYGTDQASVLLGLVSHQRQTNDPRLLERIVGLTESSLDAQLASGAVTAGRFDSMWVGTEEDEKTGRADALLDNGAVAVSFNHLRLVVASGGEHRPGVTWGAFGLVSEGRAALVDGGEYAFSVDPASLPERVRADQGLLGVSRLFTRHDGRLRVRETASVERGLPALRVSNAVENLGPTPLPLSEVRVTVGDFLHYGDGSNEVLQNRYGLSQVIEGVPLHVGVWMEGLHEPLWGDNFAPGWVDLSELYRQLKPRYLAVYAYDRAQLYYIPELADQLVLYNAAQRSLEPGTGSAGSGGLGPSKDGYEGWTTLELRYRVTHDVPVGGRYTSPAISSYGVRAPLFSADDDSVPDELQRLAPLWTELLEARSAPGGVASGAPLAVPSDRVEARRGRVERHDRLEPDSASLVLHLAWAEAADLLRASARASDDPARRERLEHLAARTRTSALLGASNDMTLLTHLRNRFDLMPSYGTGKSYGFHIPLFDWAYRQTRDPRYRDALFFVADRIASSEREGGLQITEPGRPNLGAYVQNELERDRGANNLDDQGIKLWALRVAYDRSHDPKYRESAQRCIERWIRIREEDDLFVGTSKLFEHYVQTGKDQQRTPLGQYALLLGLKAWSDVSVRARALYERGLRNARTLHPVHAIGTSGVLEGVYPDERVVHFGTDAELGGLFLWAMTYQPARQSRVGVR